MNTTTYFTTSIVKWVLMLVTSFFVVLVLDHNQLLIISLRKSIELQVSHASAYSLLCCKFNCFVRVLLGPNFTTHSLRSAFGLYFVFLWQPLIVIIPRVISLISCGNNRWRYMHYSINIYGPDIVLFICVGIISKY